MDAFLALEKYPQAEQLIMDELRNQIAEYQGRPSSLPWSMKLKVSQLVYVYFKAQRYAEIRTLLDEFPYWSVC